MRRHTTVLATAILALSLAPVLQAQGYDDHHDRSQDGQDRDGRQGYRHAYPDAGHLGRAAAIAREIDATATQMRRQFGRNNRRPDRSEARTIDSLNRLNAAAARFHDEVERSRDPRRSADEFADLERAFQSTERSLRRIAPRPYVDSGMERIYALMNELGGFYGHRSGYYGTWGHDRDWNHDHDRYDRNGDGRDRDGHDRDNRDNRDNGYRPPYNR
jgi:hypothetical protein